MGQLSDPELFRGQEFNDRSPHEQVAERARLEAHLRRRLAVEGELADMATSFVRCADFEAAAAGLLAWAGRLVEANRAYLCRLRSGGERIEAVHEWCASGVEPIAVQRPNQTTFCLPWLMSCLLVGQALCVEDVARLPEEAAAERGLCRSQGIASFVCFPIFSGAELVGWFGCTDPTGPRAGDGRVQEDHRALEIVAAVLSSALKRETIPASREQRMAGGTHDPAALAVVEERQRMARELHDAVTPSLYGLTLFARAARQAAQDGDAARLDGNLAEIEASANYVLREMRLLLHQVQPLALQDKGLVEALDDRFNAVERRLGIQVDYQADGRVGLPENAEAEVYRIAVEALNNALRHAGATALQVRLHAERQRVAFSIADNGCGFDPAQVAGGMGLANMRERSRRLGGRLEIISRLGSGTEIRFEVDVGRA